MAPVRVLDGLGTRWGAPFALRHYPACLVVVCVAALLVATTAASPPLTSTAVAGAALKTKIAEVTPLGAGLEIRHQDVQGARESEAHVERRVDAVRAELQRLAGGLHFVKAPLATTLTLPIDVSSRLASGGNSQISLRLMARPGSLANVEVLREAPGPGVWLANLTASQLRVSPGDRIVLESASPSGRMRRASVRVKGVFRALAYSPQTPYWINFYNDIYPPNPDDPPPASFAFASPAQIFRLGRQLGGLGFDDVLEIPVDQRHITLTGARHLAQQLESIRLEVANVGSPTARGIGCTGVWLSCVTSTSLEQAVTIAQENLAAVSPAVTLLADAGTAITLAVAGAAGVFLVRRRRGEAALLFARGMAAPVFAGRTAAEVLLPAVLAGGAGFGLAYLLTGLFAPNGTIDAATVRTALAHAAVAVAVAVLLLAAAAGFAFGHLFETSRRARPWLRLIPWEPPLLGVGIYLLLSIRSGGGLAASGSSGQHPTLAVFVSPLLLTAGVAGFATRVGRWLLNRHSRRARALPTPVFVAVRRLAAARGLVVALSVTCAVALAGFCYAETLAASLRRTAAGKAYIATGGDAQGTIEESQTLPRRFLFPITRVQLANQTATIGSPLGRQIDVMLVDPKTLGTTLRWRSEWGKDPLPELASEGNGGTRSLPVVVTPDIAGARAIFVAGARIPVRVLGTVRAFPGMSVGVPLLVTPARALSGVAARKRLLDPLGVLWTYVWGRGPPARVARALAASPLHPYYLATTDTFRRNPDVLLATRTFGFMRAIAAGAGALVLVALLLYVQARQRSQTLATALSRRMGLRRLAEIAEVSLELGILLLLAGATGGVLGVASARVISGHIDPLPQYAPGPAFVTPTSEIVGLTAAMVVLTVVAGAATTWIASRADAGRAFRGA